MNWKIDFIVVVLASSALAIQAGLGISTAFAFNPEESLIYWLALSTIILVCAFGLFRLRQQMVDQVTRTRSWRSYSRKTSVSAHKFIVDRIVDLRRPLQGLVGIHDLYTNNNSNQEASDFLDIADFCSRYLIRQLERIQYFSELELGTLKFDKKVFSLKKCVQDSITMAAEQAKANHVSIVEEYSPSVSDYVIGNEMSLRKLLIELLDNSVRHGGNTKVVIKIQQDPENPERIMFVINDNGPGISGFKLRDMNSSFKPSKRMTPWRDARAGLGILIVKNILNRLGGKLNASSQSGLGATVSFSLPKENLSVSHKPENLIQKIFQTPKILLVDDEDVTRQVLKTQFQRFGIKADIAVNGYDAIEKAKIKNYDLILMDLSMPVIDGFVASRTILNLSNISKHPKIIMATSHCRQEDRTRCEQIGVSGFIAKPIQFEDLKETLLSLGFLEGQSKNNSDTNDNVVKVDFSINNRKSKFKKGGYYINFNALFNSLDENMPMCKQILARASKDSSTALEEMALALEQDNRKMLSDILHRLHGELAMIHCNHGLDKIMSMHKMLDFASRDELQSAFEIVSDFVDRLCDEIGEIIKEENQTTAA